MGKFQLTAFRLVLILVHFWNYVTDILMMVKYWQEGYMYYFWITAIAAFVSWLICLWVLAELFSYNSWKFTVLFLMITHLDYPVLICHKQQSYSVKMGTRKYLSTGVQATFALLISVHYMFIAQDLSQLTLLSILGSIVDISYTAVLYNLFKEDLGQVDMMNIETIKLVIPQCILITCQNFFIVVAFGFVSFLYDPAGAFVFVGVAIVLMIVLTYFSDGGHSYFIEVLVIALAGALFMEMNSIDRRNGISFFRIQRLIVFIGSVIAIAVVHDQFASFLTEETIWPLLAYVACGTFVLWVIVNLLLGFKEIEAPYSNNWYLSSDPKGGIEFDLDWLHNF